MGKRFLGIIFCFIFFSSIVLADSYPQIDIAGRKRWFYSSLTVSPLKNYQLALRNSLLQSWPASGPWIEELKLYIQGDLSEDWAVDYKLEQSPLIIDRYDIKVTFRNYSLIFGSPEEIFAHQEFILKDYASGLALASEWEKVKLALFLSGAYSENSVNGYTGDYSAFELFRNPDYTGNRAFSYHIDDPEKEFRGLELGRIDIAAESLQVFMDEKKLIKDVEFYFDQRQGLVLISEAVGLGKNARLEYRLKSGIGEEKAFNYGAEAKRRAFLVFTVRILDAGEVITVDGVRQERDLDYFIDYNSGLIVMAKPLHDDAEVRIDYDYTYGANLYESETFTNQSGVIIALAHNYIISDSELVIKNDDPLTEGTDYRINYTTGNITLLTALTTADTVEVTYSYQGIRQNVMAANAEYDLNGWSKIGCSVTSITPSIKDEALFDEIAPASHVIGNLYNRTVINQDSYLEAELALSSSQPDYRRSSSVESDSAVKVFGRTQLGPVRLDSTYRKIGAGFASTRKTRNLMGWKEESLATALNYDLLSNLHVKNSYSVSTTKSEEDISESKRSVLLLDFLYQPFTFWNIDLEWRKKDIESPGLVAYTTGLYSNFNFNPVLPILDSFSYKMELVYKEADIKQGGAEVSGTIEAAPVDETSSCREIGLLTNYKCGLSTFINYKRENGGDNTTGDTYTCITPYVKVSYKLGFVDNYSFEIYADQSLADQTSATSYHKKDTGYGFVFDLPVANPVLSGFKMGGSFKTTDYVDLSNASNDYFSTQMEVFGSMVF